MLSKLQTDKLTHYFNLLDYDNNGIIEREDFTNVSENLCILWGMKQGTDGWNKNTKMFNGMWEDFRNNVKHADQEHATLSEWLEFCDLKLVNGDDSFFHRYVLKSTADIFDCFDVNRDGYIALDEYIDLFMAYHIQVRYSAKSFTKLDLNGDDMLSKAELLTAVQEFFKSNDPNAPGNWLFGFWEKG